MATTEPYSAPELGPAPSEEMIENLERDQLVSETARPLARARLTRRTSAALWTLRVFVIVVGAMVTYTFFYQLH
jgi:hypothetical protein